MKFLSSQIAAILSQGEMRENLRGLFKYLIGLLATVLLFSVLFHMIMLEFEGEYHSWITGIYWTLVTMSTLGFGDITFHSDVGRLFSVVVLLSGIVLLLVMLPFTFIRLFYAPWLEARLKLRAPRSIPEGTHDHVIVCHYDSIAPGLISRLSVNAIPYFVIESDPAAAARMFADGISVIAGEVDSRLTYETLQVEKAALVVANVDDTTNTNIILTVREIAPTIPVAAIVEWEDSIDVLELSGATHVLPLKKQLGEQLANRVQAGKTHSHVIGSFRETLLIEFPIQGTDFAGKTLRETRLREKTGVTVVSIWERGRLLPLTPNTVLSSTMILMAMGTRRQIERLEQKLFRLQELHQGPVLIIGGGKVGRAASRALKDRGVEVHLLERKAELLPKLEGLVDHLWIGDASDRRLLSQAGLEQATSVLLTTHDDAMNIFLAVYCRQLAPSIRMASRCTHDRNLEALHRAGADFVLSYSSLGVESIFSLVQKRPPILVGSGAEFFLTSVPRRLSGKTLAESAIGATTGLTVICIEENEHVVANPQASKILEHGSRLLLLGTREQREKFKKAFE